MRSPIGGNERALGPSKRKVTSPDPATGARRKRPRISRVQKHASYRQDASAMVDEMLNAGVGQDGKTVPWNVKGDNEWPIGLMRVVIGQLFGRKECSTFTSRVVETPSSTGSAWSLKIPEIDYAPRDVLNRDLNNLWTWAVQRKTSDSINKADDQRNGAQEVLERYKTDPGTVLPVGDDLARLLLRSLPKVVDKNNMVFLPWHPQVNVESLTWTDSWIKIVLEYLWKQQISAGLPSSNERKQILTSEPNSQNKERLQKAMDRAWALWAENTRNRNERVARGKKEKAEAAWKEMEITCKEKYADFTYSIEAQPKPKES
ncbi:hypothetical protein H0H93_004786 [Arthromyces matolae]|nr:hypothetical protein H0H93_004786 [Arthromyces matolae]